jgi:hypothetical protein
MQWLIFNVNAPEDSKSYGKHGAGVNRRYAVRTASVAADHQWGTACAVAR